MDLSASYNYYIFEVADQRVKDWPFMSSPVPLVAVTLLYLLVIFKIGPQYMSNRPAFSLKNVIISYNIFQVIANFTLFYQVLTNGWLTTYTLGCQLTDYSNNPEAIRMAKTVWWVFALKMVDFVETVFFVLRKKNKQMSFLHVYHHIVTLYLVWIGAKYAPGGSATFPILLNTFVHVLMYTYYLVTIFGTHLKAKFEKWKQTLTTIQMTQFVIIFVYSLQVLAPSCEIPKVLFLIFIPNLILVFYLFYDFYLKNYVKKDLNKKSI